MAEVDLVLIGNGLAPLITAARLVRDGRSVLLLNPDRDFFEEDSELSFDPFFPWPETRQLQSRLKEAELDSLIQVLRPEFPGSVEVWPGDSRDPRAPYIRSRSRLVLSQARADELLVLADDLGFAPAEFEGIKALKAFPGVSPRRTDAQGLRGVLVPRLGDVDVSRYRNGVLEFVRERIGASAIACGASQIDFMDDAVRFLAGGYPQTIRTQQVVIYWTPKLTSWVLSQCRAAEQKPSVLPQLRLWEEWSVISRDPLDPGVIGHFNELCIWAGIEGAAAPHAPTDGDAFKRMQILRPGRLLLADEMERFWASKESFVSLELLINEFMAWDRFRVRGLKVRALFERSPADESSFRSWNLARGDLEPKVVVGVDGPIAGVVAAGARVAEELA